MGQEVEQGWRGNRAGTHSHSTGWNLTQGSTRTLTHSLTQLPLRPALSLRPFWLSNLVNESEREREREEKECPMRSLCLLPVYSYSARSAQFPIPYTSLSPLYALSFCLFRAAPTRLPISLLCHDFWRSLSRSCSRSRSLVWPSAFLCVTFIIPLPPQRRCPPWAHFAAQRGSELIEPLSSSRFK